MTRVDRLSVTELTKQPTRYQSYPEITRTVILRMPPQHGSGVFHICVDLNHQLKIRTRMLSHAD